VLEGALVSVLANTWRIGWDKAGEHPREKRAWSHKHARSGSVKSWKTAPKRRGRDVCHGSESDHCKLRPELGTLEVGKKRRMRDRTKKRNGDKKGANGQDAGRQKNKKQNKELPKRL
jgi:hypothetical protein